MRRFTRFARQACSLVRLAALPVAFSLCVLPNVQAEPLAGGDVQLEPVVVGTPQRIEVQPAAFQLATPQRRMHLIVSGFYADGTTQDLTRSAEYTSSNEQVARIENGVAVPDGRWYRRNHDHQRRPVGQGDRHGLEPGPARARFVRIRDAGCADQARLQSGACHGSPSGKGGFRLSLRAYDPVARYRDAGARSIQPPHEPLEPENSLLLRKPLMEVRPRRRPAAEEERSQL